MGGVGICRGDMSRCRRDAGAMVGKIAGRCRADWKGGRPHAYWGASGKAVRGSAPPVGPQGTWAATTPRRLRLGAAACGWLQEISGGVGVGGWSGLGVGGWVWGGEVRVSDQGRGEVWALLERRPRGRVGAAVCEGRGATGCTERSGIGLGLANPNPNPDLRPRGGPPTRHEHRCLPGWGRWARRSERHRVRWKAAWDPSSHSSTPRLVRARVCGVV